MDMYYGIILLFYFGSDFVSGTPVTQNDTVIFSQQAQHNGNENVNDNLCYCNKHQSNTPTVSKHLNPNNDELERLVVYLYRNKANGKVSLYIPNEQKQYVFPDQSLDTEDLLENVENTPFAQLLVDNPHVVTKEVFSKIPDFEGKHPKPHQDELTQNKLKQLVVYLKKIFHDKQNVGPSTNEYAEVIQHQVPLDQQKDETLLHELLDGHALKVHNGTHYVLIETVANHKHNIFVPKSITYEQYLLLLHNLHHHNNGDDPKVVLEFNQLTSPTLAPVEFVSHLPVQHTNEEVPVSTVADQPVTTQNVEVSHNTEPTGFYTQLPTLVPVELVSDLPVQHTNEEIPVRTDQPVTTQNLEVSHTTEPTGFYTQLPTLVPVEFVSHLPVQHTNEVHVTTVADQPVTTQNIEVSHNTEPTDFMTQFPTLAPVQFVSHLPVQHTNEEVPVSTVADQPVTIQTVDTVPTVRPNEVFATELPTLAPVEFVSHLPVEQKSTKHVEVGHNTEPTVVPNEVFVTALPTLIPVEYVSNLPVQPEEVKSLPEVYVTTVTDKPVTVQHEDHHTVAPQHHQTNVESQHFTYAVPNSHEKSQQTTVPYDVSLYEMPNIVNKNSVPSIPNYEDGGNEVVENKLHHITKKMLPSSAFNTENYELLLKLILTHPEIKNKLSLENLIQIISQIYNNQRQSIPVQNENKFDSWFNEQMQTINYDKAERQSHLIDKKSLKLIIQEQLFKHGWHIYKNLLLDKDGSVYNINDLQLVPLLVGSDVGANNLFNLSLPELFKLFTRSPYFFALLLKLRSSGLPIGIVPLSKKSDLIKDIDQRGGSESIDLLLKQILEKSNTDGHMGEISSSQNKYYFTSVPFEVTEKPVSTKVSGKKIIRKVRRKSKKTKPVDARLVAFIRNNKNHLSENSYKKLSSALLNPPLVDHYISGANKEKLQNVQLDRLAFRSNQNGNLNVPLSESNSYGELVNFLQNNLGLQLSQQNGKVNQSSVASLGSPPLVNKSVGQDLLNQLQLNGLKLNWTGIIPGQLKNNSGVNLKLPNVKENADLSFNGALPSASHKVGAGVKSLAELSEGNIGSVLNGAKSVDNLGAVNRLGSLGLSSSGDLESGIQFRSPKASLKVESPLNSNDSELKSVEKDVSAEQKTESPSLNLGSASDASSSLESNLAVGVNKDHPVSALKRSNPNRNLLGDLGGSDFELDVDKDDYLSNDDDEKKTVNTKVRFPSVPGQHSSNPQYRIIGGSSATGSGLPLSNRGREGVIKFDV